MIPIYDLCISNDIKNRLYFTYHLNSRNLVSTKIKVYLKFRKNVSILVLLNGGSEFNYFFDTIGGEIMNTTIQQLFKHVSVREFKKEPLSDEVKQILVAAARSAATSHFVQAFSILEITDPELREKLAEITDSASYVKETGIFYVFIGDLFRQSKLLLANNQSLESLRNMESLLVGVVDATIAAQNMVVAAESLELGTCYIGGIRNDIAKISELLNLPPFTIPLFGLTIGVPVHKNQVKPRLLLENQVSENQYPHEQFANLKDYEALTREYYALREKNEQQTSWSDKNIEFFKEIRRPEIATFLKKQGFTLN